MKVYLVEEIKKSPNTVLACFSDEDTAQKFAQAVNDITDGECRVVARTLYFSQPQLAGYNE